MFQNAWEKMDLMVSDLKKNYHRIYRTKGYDVPGKDEHERGLIEGLWYSMYVLQIHGEEVNGDGEKETKDVVNALLERSSWCTSPEAREDENFLHEGYVEGYKSSLDFSINLLSGGEK